MYISALVVRLTCSLLANFSELSRDPTDRESLRIEFLDLCQTMPVSRNYWYRIWGAHRHVRIDGSLLLLLLTEFRYASHSY